MRHLEPHGMPMDGKTTVTSVLVIVEYKGTKKCLLQKLARHSRMRFVHRIAIFKMTAGNN